MRKGTEEKEAERKARNAQKMRKWRANDPPSLEARAKDAERARQWREAYPDRYRVHQKAWYAKNHELLKVRRRALKASDREMGKENPPSKQEPKVDIGRMDL